MTLKEQLIQGNAILQSCKDMLTKITELEQNKNDKATLEFLLDIQKLEFEDRVKNTEARLEQIKKQFLIEFELQSAEANSKIEVVIFDAQKYIGKEPKNITDKIQPLIDMWDASKPYMEQEKKNDLYFELKAHLKFLKETYQKK